MTRQRLEGARILVTAERAMGARLAHELTELGAVPIALPCIHILPPRDPDALRAAVARRNEADWVVLTSANGVEAFASVLAPTDGPAPRIAVIGPATSRRLAETTGLEADLLPPAAKHESLAAALIAEGVAGRKVLLFQNDIADPELEASLLREGALVEKVEAYRTVEGPESPAAAREVVLEGRLAAITFMSASSARALAAACGTELLEGHRLVCIGPATAAEVARLGLRPTRVAATHTLAGLVDAVIEEIGKPSGGNQ